MLLTLVPGLSGVRTVAMARRRRSCVRARRLPITPFGAHPDWNGTITVTGVWGEQFTDQNGDGVWNSGEPFVDDPGNTEIDRSSLNKYDGIYLAGFGNKRLATGRHDDLVGADDRARLRERRGSRSSRSI
jgi:hypothetical protein